MTTRARLSAFPGYAVERSAGEQAGIELLVCRTVRYRRQPDGRSFRRAQAVLARSPDARAAVNAEIALLAGCAGPGLPQLLETADGSYVTPLLSADTLEDRLARHELGDADLRRVSARLRSAVLSLHDGGRTHGRLGAGAVRFTGDGDPVLTGLRETAPLTAAGRQRDLRALDALRARLGAEGGESAVLAPPARAAGATRSGVGDDDASLHAGDSAADVTEDPAATVLRELAHRRAARRAVPGAPHPRRRATTTRQRQWQLHRSALPVAGGAVALGVLTAAAFALATARGPSPSPEQASQLGGEGVSSGVVAEEGGAAGGGAAEPAVAPAPEDTTEADPVSVLQELVDARTAWITGAAVSDRANAPGAPAMSADSALRSAWQGAEVSDWRVRVLEATAVEGELIADPSGADVVLDARMQDRAGTAAWPDGTAVEIPASGVYSARVTLQPVAGDWRIVEVERR